MRKHHSSLVLELVVYKYYAAVVSCEATVASVEVVLWDMLVFQLEIY